MSESDVSKISDEDLVSGLAAFKENLKYLAEEGIIVSMNEFVKVKSAVKILEKELIRRNKERLTIKKHGRFTIYSRKDNG